MSRRIRANSRFLFFSIRVALLGPWLWIVPAKAVVTSFSPGQILVLDSNAGAGNGNLFEVNRATGGATPIGSAFGLEPWSMVLQSPTSLVAADVTGETVYRFNTVTGNWSDIASSPHLLAYPSGAMVADTDHSVLVAGGGGKVIRFDTNTGQQSLYADYSSLGTADPWGMTRLPDGSLIVSDRFVGTLVRIAPDGSSSILSTGGLLHSTAGIVALPDGTVAVGDDNIHGLFSIVRVSLVDGSQSYITPLGSFSWVLNGLSLDTDGNLLAAVAQNTSRGAVYKVRLSDGAITPFSTDSHFANPTAVMIVPEPSLLGTVAFALATLARRCTLGRVRRVGS